VAALLAGLIMDNYDPNLVWYIAGVLSLIAVASFWILHLRTHDRLESAPLNEADITPE
jgi:predicted MFS family arabinose efflux permease